MVVRQPRGFTVLQAEEEKNYLMLALVFSNLGLFKGNMNLSN